MKPEIDAKPSVGTRSLSDPAASSDLLLMAGIFDVCKESVSKFPHQPFNLCLMISVKQIVFASNIFVTKQTMYKLHLFATFSHDTECSEIAKYRREFTPLLIARLDFSHLVFCISQ